MRADIVTLPRIEVTQLKSVQYMCPIEASQDQEVRACELHHPGGAVAFTAVTLAAAKDNGTLRFGQFAAAQSGAKRFSRVMVHPRPTSDGCRLELEPSEVLRSEAVALDLRDDGAAAHD